MSREQVIGDIVKRLEQLHIQFSKGNGADITVSTEFLDAGWSIGKKKITYEASIYCDEGSRTVYMWELTKEVGHGLSFGGSSGSSFQTGLTLFRKVKSVQYGPEGKVYEYTLDLGAIPKAAKETAKAAGWSFKTVLKKDKASWPVGYAPVEPSTAPSPQGGPFCTSCGNKLPQDAVFCPTCGKKR